jgi:hypothetical protein
VFSDVCCKCVYLDVAYIFMYILQVFYLNVAYVCNGFHVYLDVAYVFTHILQVFYLNVAYVCNRFQVFLGVFCKCSRNLFQVFHLCMHKCYI